MISHLHPGPTFYHLLIIPPSDVSKSMFFTDEFTVFMSQISLKAWTLKTEIKSLPNDHLRATSYSYYTTHPDSQDPNVKFFSVFDP